MIPHDISDIRRKESYNKSEFTSGSMEANLMRRTESLISMKKAESFNFVNKA